MSIRIEHEDHDIWAFHINGEITREDLMAAQADVIQRAGREKQIRLLALLEEFAGWEKTKAWKKDEVDAPHRDDVKRMAIVGDPKWEAPAMMFVGAGVRKAQIQYFPTGFEVNARLWLRSE